MRATVACVFCACELCDLSGFKATTWKIFFCLNMPDTPTSPSFSDVRQMSNAQFSKLTKHQLSLALKEAVDFAEKRVDSETPSISPQMLKSVVTEAVCEIRDDLMRETRRLISELHNSFQVQMRNEIQNLKEEIKSELIEEFHKREAKKNNVIIFGLPENQSDSAKDHEQVTDLLSTLGCATNFKRCFRIGVQGSRPRPTKIIFDKFEERQTVVKSASSLSRLDRDHAFRRVYIKPDMTADQLAQDKRLQRLLKERRDGGEDVILRRGRIVPRSLSYNRSRKPTLD